MTSSIAASERLSPFLPLLGAWVDLANKRTAMPQDMGNPWWTSVEARMGALEEAATLTGWRVRVPIDPDTEFWDMHVQHDDQRFLVRCVAAMQPIARGDDSRLFLESAGRLAQVEQQLKKGPSGDAMLQVLFVIPYLRANEASDDEANQLLEAWLASEPFQAEAHAWMGATAPVLRNASGWVFLGIGLLLQPAYQHLTTS